MAGRARPLVVTLAYAVVAVVMTWPLSRDLGTHIAADLGDPVFNCWVLLWTSGQVMAALSGDWGALGQYWNGNIFHPEPYTLAYSEHLTPQMLQALPVLALTGNVVTAYNLLFLSTFVLCGLGVYLLVRELTGARLAAFVAGLAYAWAPYRMAQVPHLQVLSSCWMPFALLGFHRYFATRRPGPLVGGSAALAAQNLSCGYFLLYFPPFLAAYCIYEMARRRLLAQWRVWLALAIALAAVAVVTWPFVEPYLALKARGEIGVRTPEEIRSFSADIWSFASASPSLRLLGDRMNAFPKPEGEGFPGLTIALLALVAMSGAAWRSVRTFARRPMSLAARTAVLGPAVVLAVSATIAFWIAGASGLRVSMGGTLFIFYNPIPALRLALVAGLVLVTSAALARRRLDEPGRWPVLFFGVALAAAAVLALGPVVTSAGRPMFPGPFALLHDYVPGFEGGRVPARFLMLAALFWAVLAGFGAARLLTRLPRRAAAVTCGLLMAGILAESWVAPMRRDIPVGVPPDLVSPTGLRPGRSMSPLYGVISNLPDPVVLIEFPFGEPADDLQAMFYAGYHRRPIVNGYSGYAPVSYQRRAGGLRDPLADPGRAAAWLEETGATHALVHEAWFADGGGPAVSAWLVSLGARPVVSDGSDKLFELK